MKTSELTQPQRIMRCASCGLPRVAHLDDGPSTTARRIGRSCDGFVEVDEAPPNEA